MKARSVMTLAALAIAAGGVTTSASGDVVNDVLALKKCGDNYAIGSVNWQVCEDNALANLGGYTATFQGCPAPTTPAGRSCYQQALNYEVDCSQHPGGTCQICVVIYDNQGHTRDLCVDYAGVAARQARSAAPARTF